MKKLLLTLLIGTSLSISQPLFAQESENHRGSHNHEMAMPESVPVADTMLAVESSYATLSEAATTGKYDKIHELSEALKVTLKSLAEAHKDDAAITGTVTQLSKVLSGLHTAGDEKDAAKLGVEIKKLDGGIKLLKARMPTGMNNGHQEKQGATEQGLSNLQAVALGLETLKSGQENTLTLKLTDASGDPVPLDKLQEVHTKKVHWLIVDETLGDYHHVHPTAGQEPGTYVASFTPEKAGTYKVWVDVTPVGATQQYIPVELKGEKPCGTPCVEKTLDSEGESGGLKANLTFEKPLTAGAADMGKVTITDKDGKPVTDLEPVMGAFAHVVAFYEDFATVAHVHPMGEEPKSETQRGGPDLMFHLEPEKAGFLKIYVQVKRGGKDIFISLGTTIQG
jgi:hypothetical protein